MKAEEGRWTPLVSVVPVFCPPPIFWLERASPGSPCELIARVMRVDRQPTVVPFMPPRLETVFWSPVGSRFFFYSGDWRYPCRIGLVDVVTLRFRGWMTQPFPTYVSYHMTITGFGVRWSGRHMRSCETRACGLVQSSEASTAQKNKRRLLFLITPPNPPSSALFKTYTSNIIMEGYVYPCFPWLLLI